MNKFIWVVLAVSVLAVSSRAQGVPAADVSAGYSFFRAGGSGGVNLNGFNTTAAYNANSWFGVVGDFGFYGGSPSGVSVNAFTYTVGPRFSIRKSERIVPFAQATFGASHLSASFAGVSGSANPFTYSVGGGADVALSRSGKVALRPEVEYFRAARERRHVQLRAPFGRDRLPHRTEVVACLSACARPGILPRPGAGHPSEVSLILERRIHVAVLKDLLQIRADAQVGDVIGNRRKAVRHMLRDDDDVAGLHLAAGVSDHRAAAGRAVQNGGHFAVRGGAPAVDDGAAHDQGPAA